MVFHDFSDLDAPAFALFFQLPPGIVFSWFFIDFGEDFELKNECFFFKPWKLRESHSRLGGSTILGFGAPHFSSFFLIFFRTWFWISFFHVF